MENWDALIATLPEPHLLQTKEWGQLKSQFGWWPMHKLWQDGDGRVQAAALILERTIPIGGFADQLRVLYVPKGPLLNNWEDASLRQQVLGDLEQFARQRRAIFIKIDPDVRLGLGIPAGAHGVRTYADISDSTQAQEFPAGQDVANKLRERGWCFSEEQIQFRNTVILDLTPTEAQLLANMKQKTRYNLHLAERKGVSVRVADRSELGLLYRMYAETSLRDGFIIRDEAYYRAAWEIFIQAGLATPLVAEVSEGDSPPEVVAGLILFHFAGRAWYLHGMSRQAHREKMPNYLLQWEAIRRAKAAGCTTYDLWGAPNVFSEDDPLLGVFRFKLGLGGSVVRTIGAWDFPVRPLAYKLYAQVLPRLLERMRRHGKAETRKVALTGG